MPPCSKRMDLIDQQSSLNPTPASAIQFSKSFLTVSLLLSFHFFTYYMTINSSAGVPKIPNNINLFK